MNQCGRICHNINYPTPYSPVKSIAKIFGGGPKIKKKECFLFAISSTKTTKMSVFLRVFTQLLELYIFYVHFCNVLPVITSSIKTCIFELNHTSFVIKSVKYLKQEKTESPNKTCNYSMSITTFTHATNTCTTVAVCD